MINSEVAHSAMREWLARRGLKNHICPFGTGMKGILPPGNPCKEVCAVIFPDILIEEVPVCPCTIHGTMQVSKTVRRFLDGKE